MKWLNRYYRRSRIAEKKFREIIKYYALDLTANKTAELTGLTHKTVNQIYLKIRQRLAEDSQRQSPFSGEVEVDESYFGARRVKGKRGRGAGGKTIVFGIYKRNGKVFTRTRPGCPEKDAASHYSRACQHRDRCSLRRLARLQRTRRYRLSEALSSQSFGQRICQRNFKYQRHRKLLVLRQKTVVKIQRS